VEAPSLRAAARPRPREKNAGFVGRLRSFLNEASFSRRTKPTSCSFHLCGSDGHRADRRRRSG
jgi:hypothetical protein